VNFAYIPSDNYKRDDGRHELKYVLKDSEIGLFQSWLEQSCLSFKAHFSDRRINNIYFDDLDYSCYMDNLSGASFREKLRLRWYGNTKQLDDAVLELKVKKNRIGWKRYNRINRGDLSNCNKAVFYNVLSENVDGEIAEAYHQYNRISLLNSYKRKYFVSACKRIRITLDSDLIFYDQNFGRVLNLNKFVYGPQIHILEIKYHVDDVDIAKAVVGTNPFVPSRASKYTIGLQTLLVL
jgi:hypothetical protein